MFPIYTRYFVVNSLIIRNEIKLKYVYQTVIDFAQHWAGQIQSNQSMDLEVKKRQV